MKFQVLLGGQRFFGLCSCRCLRVQMAAVAKIILDEQTFAKYFDGVNLVRSSWRQAMFRRRVRLQIQLQIQLHSTHRKTQGSHLLREIQPQANANYYPGNLTGFPFSPLPCSCAASSRTSPAPTRVVVLLHLDHGVYIMSLKHLLALCA